MDFEKIEFSLIIFPVDLFPPIFPTPPPPAVVSVLGGPPRSAPYGAIMHSEVAYHHVFCEVTTDKTQTQRHVRVINALNWKDSKTKKIAIEQIASNANKCQACLASVQIGFGVVLAACRHSICRSCMVRQIKYSRRAALPLVTCPCCDAALHAGDVYGLLFLVVDSEAEMFDAHIKRRLEDEDVAMAVMKNIDDWAVRCRTPNCKFYMVYEDLAHKKEAKRNGPSITVCPSCKAATCLTCEVSFFFKYALHTAFDKTKTQFLFLKTAQEIHDDGVFLCMEKST